MTTCDELHELVKNPDKEGLRIEFKQLSKLQNKPEEIGYSLIALANRHGGRLIIGITDDGKFEGKGIFNVDQDKGRIDNICNNNCSPKIEYQTEFLQCIDGDVLVINVNRRRGIPHAYVRKAQDEIKERIYYVRTSHGNRLATDLQLEWMFRNIEDPRFQKSFSIQIPYYRKDLRIPLFSSLPSQDLISNPLLQRFFQQLTKLDRTYLFSDETIIFWELFLELMPYIVLFELAEYFSLHWSVNVEKRASSKTISPRRADLLKEMVDFSNICSKTSTSVLRNISVDIVKIGEKLFSGLAVPEKVNLIVKPIIDSHHNLNSMKLSFIHDNLFDVSVEFKRSEWHVNLPSGHPLLSMLREEEYRKCEDDFATVVLDCTFSASFNLFDIEIPEFNEILRWSENMRDLLEEKLSWERFIAGLPDRILYRIDRNVQDILSTLKKGNPRL